MGLFDGREGSDTASAAHVARILKAPVILVVDVHAVSRSIHAVVKGFRDFDPRVKIAGIIYNRIGSDRHRQMIAEEEFVPALGWVPRQPESEVKSRHLGLVMASRIAGDADLRPGDRRNVRHRPDPRCRPGRPAVQYPGESRQK